MAGEDDARFKYLFKQISQAFRHITVEKLTEFWNTEHVVRNVYEFLDNPETQALFFREGKGSLELTDTPVGMGKVQLFYVVKLNKAHVSDDNISSAVIYGEVSPNPLEHMAFLAQRIYHPLVGQRHAVEVWSEVVAKDVRDNFDSFVSNVQIMQGHVDGTTCLPLPNSGNAVTEVLDKEEESEDPDRYHQIHMLEGALITWTKQIKNVLKQDPESLFQTFTDPGPLAEIDFWRKKAGNLNSIFDQLQSMRVRRVLKVLDQSKSTYNAPFAKLCKEVFHARAESNNVLKYLRPLISWFEGLENESRFEELVEHFTPIIHMVLLVWKSSAYYNTPARLVVLMREISNTLIRQACLYLNGDAIFELVEAGETNTAVRMLKTALSVFGRFKTVYLEYKAKSVKECPENPWLVQNNAVFVRLDSFLERLHDILDFTQTIMMFAKLAKIEVGGTKGKTLTTSVAQIYADFNQAVESIRAVGKGILDLENKAFEDAFYEFRTRMKELDKRLGSVILQGFEDASTVQGRFRLLDSFDNLITRPIVADALEKKHAWLIESIRVDIVEVQRLCVEMKDSPLIASNLPPIAGALTWCRGLRERIQQPVSKLKTLDKKILEREDSREVIKLFTALYGQLSDMDSENIESWGSSIESSSQAKLKNPLLRREVGEGGAGSILFVNFDPVLVKLLREVKYFLLLGLEVPHTAMDVYQKVELFRRHTGNLDLIVNMYNDIQTTLLPVERPLVRAQLDRIDKTLSQGVGEGKVKAKSLNWKSNGIDLFIGETMTEVKEVSEMLQMLKNNLKSVEQTVSMWQSSPIFDRGYKTVQTIEFINLQKKTRQMKLQAVKEAGQEIHRLLKDTNKKLKVSQGLPDWKAYVDFTNNVVVYGLIDAMASTLRTMAAQFNPAYLELNGLPPLLEIQLDLKDKKVAFIPEVGLVEFDGHDTATREAESGIKNIVSGWINGILGLSSAFKRLDSGEGTYLREISESPEVCAQKAKVMRFLKHMEGNANKLRNQFRKYEYLWLTDIHQLFDEFLAEAVEVEKVPFATVNVESADTPTSTSASPGEEIQYWEKLNINLERFGEKIKDYSEIEAEVSEIKSLHDIDFIKVNVQPIKRAISTWVTKWLYMHTQYLQDFVGGRLAELNRLLHEVNSGLDLPVEGGNREALMSVMKHVHNVRKRMPEIAAGFEPMENIVILLKVNGIPIDLPPVDEHPALDFLEQAKMLWDNTVNKAFRVKENIQPQQSSMLEGIRKEVKSFNVNVAKFYKEFKAHGPFAWPDHSNNRDAYTNLDHCQGQLVELERAARAINDLEDLFELPLSTHSSIREISQDLCLLKSVWDAVCLVESLFALWRNTLWAEIDTDGLLEEVKKLQSQLKKYHKRVKDWPVFKRLELEVKNMSISLPLVHDLHSHAMRERHWKSLMAITGVTFDRGANFCLDDLLALNLQYHVDAVSEIVEVANKELKIENKLLQIGEIWRKFTLQMSQHRDTEVFVVTPPEDVLEALEEHSLLLQSMAGMGKFVEFFKEQVSYWQQSLGEVESTLKLVLMVQRQWGSLESIFLGSADIRAQLPDDTKRFEGVDAEFKEQMRDVGSKPGVLECCRSDGREVALVNMHKELEKCEKALNEYLEIKKSFFPRFYFVSNAALLDILSNGNIPAKIMQHLGSVFDGIGDLELCYSPAQEKSMKDDPETAVGPMEGATCMISKDKEVVKFPYVFEMKGAVEWWLNDLVKNMQATLKGVLAVSMTDALAWEDINKPREEWVFGVPAQIALVTSQVIWTEEVEAALEELESGQEDALKKYGELCSLRLESLIRLVQMDLSKGDRVKIITVITIDVHNRDVVGALVAKKVENNVDFKWQSQLRYYWLPDDRNVNIRICDFFTSYTFEYVGNCGRLVITPLTDRCYVTLTVALRLFLGGAPAGPAGTGKTETTKDLSRGLGLPCYVFNCSDQMNYQTMGDIFKGLTQVGAWGCFDEFNRIEIEVLSVVATQVRCILDAIIRFALPSNRDKEFQSLPAGTPPSKVGTFNFFGEDVSMVPTVGLFITMNPGYAGRTELPENLKALFRSCAMIQPDFLPISENMLMAEGFVRARPLSVKFVTLYKLSSELLSKQHHYDWGLRAIKSVLRVAGVLKRADPNFEEEAILMRALRDFNTPKIPSNDIPIFLRLISDLFPGLDLAPKVNESLQQTCEQVCKATSLCPEELFVSKVMQYQELLDVRHSVMLLGPAGCGKTSVWKTLAGCHNHNHTKPVTMYETVNPKSVTTDELYGYMTLTKDWRDGVLSIVMRNMSKNIAPYHANQTGKWVVLDGDIDAVWIESMNTVMDDNKVLTLVSNERIPLSDAMRMVFEIHTLKNATPATVSRAGILYINDTDVGYQPYIESWMGQRTNETEKSYLPFLLNQYFSKVVDFYAAAKLQSIVPLPLINLVQSFCFLLDGMLKNLAEKDQDAMERVFLFALMWAFGGALTADKQTDFKKSFSNFFRTLNKKIKFPEAGTVLDYFIDPASGDVVPWQDKVQTFTSSAPEGASSNIVVPTADTVRLTYLLSYLVRNSRPVMFVGSAGTGKTVLVKDYLDSLGVTDEAYKSATINMNFYTDALALQNQLEQNVDKRSGKTYGPPSGKLIYFVDDLNLPFVETYGTQTPIALMRQHIDHSSWFDRTDLSLKKNIVDAQYVACMNHKSGSFFIDPRLQRHFVTFACQMPSDQDLATIFGTILTGHVYNFDRSVTSRVKNITDATITLHREICAKFLPSAVKFHYNFTMRDLAAVFRGLLNSRPEEQRAAAQFTRLWYHEVMRVFSDRLISDVEVLRCRDVVVNVGKRFMEDDAELVYADPCTYTHFISADESGGYKLSDDFNQLKFVLETKLGEYNETNAIMSLVLFEQAIRHVTRITRILMFPGGNALLVGVGGSGKQSLSKLAASICGYSTSQIAVTSDYGVNDLKEHLRDLYKKAGVKPAEPLVFLLTDSQIIDERFLVYINDLLSSGRIPDLFTKEDYDGIFGSLRSAAKQEGIPDSRETMMDFFIGRVRANLHMVLCFSPVGDTFRQRARKFPGIINCTSIDWFHEWPREALVSVAQRFLEDVDTGDKPEVRDNIAYHIAEVHTSVGVASLEYLKKERRYNYTTPKSFLELISFFKSLLAQRRHEMFEKIQRLDTGLKTLMRTNRDVEQLQEFLKEKKKEVEAKKAATDKLLEEMGKQRSEAEAQQSIADVEKKKADAAADEAAKLEAQAAGDLAIASPALEAANNAVKCLDKASLTELKSFSKPPAGVDKVTTALLIMIKGEKKDFSWENAKKMMAKVDAFKEKLERYKGEDIPEEVIGKVLPMLDDPEFTFEKMKTKSAAAANLANWVINIIQYNGIYKRVKPLMESLDMATRAKRRAEEDLDVVQAVLTAIEAKLSTLQGEFMAATQEKARVEQEAKECLDRLSLAERLTNGLASEKDRWGLTVEGLRSQEETLAGDVMLAAAFTSYIGAFGAEFRLNLWKTVWVQDLIGRDIPLTANVDPMHVLTNDSQMAVWQNEGLPADRISLENGAIITNCNRWPLLIDPQLQGIRWLKRYEEIRCGKNGRQVVILKQGEKLWMSKIVLAIQQGDTVILENIGENLDASLDSVLTKAVFRKGKTIYLKVGDEDVEYDENFRLYLQTKMSNPHYKPEIAAQCTIINFIVTRKGLEDQLLATIVSEEQPELEHTKNALVQAFNTYKIQLKDLEDLLLERLANAPTDILSDIPLIEGLEATKFTATEINEAVAKGIQTEIGINQAREVYRGVAVEASLLYFVLLQLCYVDHMYQYSLDSFTMFFLKALKIAPGNAVTSDPVERVVSLQTTLRWTIFKWVVRGLFEKHRLIFMTQLALSLMQQGIVGEESGFTPEGLRFLLFGPKLGDEKTPISWLSDTAWSGIRTLSMIDGFEKLPSDIEENSPRFLEWYQHYTPEAERLPGSWRELDKQAFKKLMVVRVLRPDRMTAALSNFIRDTIPKGKDFVECDSELNSLQILEQSFEDSSPAIPLYFILSPGADVVSDVDKLALKMGKQKGVDYHNISLGQGQDIVAEEKLDVGNRQGHWVFLNNVHLMPRWLTRLEKKMEEYAVQGTHPDFRIMFSSDPSNSIPVSVLDRCIKITSDPPSGLKANLKQAFACFSREMYEELESRTKGILFGLCQFHAVMVERKKFGAKGYNMMYPFSIGDLVCSASVLRNYMESAPAKVPWADLRYLFGEIMYGGHIVNDFDRLLANTYLEFYMKDELLEEMPMYPHLENGATDAFKAPSTSSNYDSTLEHIDEELKGETPLAFGLHPNAEIGFRTQTSEELLRVVLELSATGDGAGAEGQDSQQTAEAVIQDVMETLRDVKYETDAIAAGLDDVGPFQNVILQECERMNGLVGEVVRSLVELDLGFKGDLTVSDAMEELALSLYLDRVPKRWEGLAYPSLRPLSAWLADLVYRITQLNDWVASPHETPVVTWLPGLFNPPSFLTAIMQIVAQSQSLELDKLTLVTDITKKMSPEEFTALAKDGTYISGLFLEGGSWNLNAGTLESSKPREMFCPLPVINIRPAVVDKFEPGTYLCPVYKTQQRGPTYVFSLQLKTKADPGKWVLAGVVSIMDIL
ncbi:dynein heavy chain and region D6 of dynein motor-domain-containing protein [Ochromonadaceae sp. CCMP2298]|nr:dynein heavy chain and region D6 of dynein motor-domain-containing protein [Ochromonadaceae sp. CCMP2298]